MSGFYPSRRHGSNPSNHPLYGGRPGGHGPRHHPPDRSSSFDSFDTMRGALHPDDADFDDPFGFGDRPPDYEEDDPRFGSIERDEYYSGPMGGRDPRRPGSNPLRPGHGHNPMHPAFGGGRGRGSPGYSSHPGHSSNPVYTSPGGTRRGGRYGHPLDTEYDSFDEGGYDGSEPSIRRGYEEEWPPRHGGRHPGGLGRSRSDDNFEDSTDYSDPFGEDSESEISVDIRRLNHGYSGHGHGGHGYDGRGGHGYGGRGRGGYGGPGRYPRGGYGSGGRGGGRPSDDPWPSDSEDSLLS
ncbi:MAG: hypothetical protein Q9170_003399 [Blastenia crenularia]